MESRVDLRKCSRAAAFSMTNCFVLDLQESLALPTTTTFLRLDGCKGTTQPPKHESRPELACLRQDGHVACVTSTTRSFRQHLDGQVSDETLSKTRNFSRPGELSP